MLQAITTLLSGLLFGAGLAISGMMDPKRVRGFLDIFGEWDPTLAFVMGGAIIIMIASWQIQKRLAKPSFADAFDLPGKHLIDRNLIFGAVVFGIGWGLSGLCPGPAIGSLLVEPVSAGIFVLSMAIGMFVHRVTNF